MLITSHTIIVENDKDVEDVRSRYYLISMDIDEISNSLWINYGLILVDRRDKTEYTQCNAQNSPDFCSEDLTLSELEETNAKKDIYKQ